MKKNVSDNQAVARNQFWFDIIGALIGVFGGVSGIGPKL